MRHENVVFATDLGSGPGALVLAVHHQRRLHVERAILGDTRIIELLLVLLFYSSAHNLLCAAAELSSISRRCNG